MLGDLVYGWTYADEVNNAQFEHLLEVAERELGRFVGADGTLSFSAPAHIVTTTKT